MGRIAELRARVRGIPGGALWVCQCCMLAHANGECCPDEDHGGDGIQPWAAWDDRHHATMGLLAEEHHGECPVNIEGSHNAVEECDCERTHFTWSRCDGCNSFLGGERWAFTMWREPRVFRSGWAA